MKTRPSHITAVLALLIGTIGLSSPRQQARAVPPYELTRAVVRIPSHGASATIIHTEMGRTLLLGCGHAYRGADRSKPMVLDLPTAHPRGTSRKVGITLFNVDYESDLSLVCLHDGPVEYVAPVAPAGHQPGGRLLSAGYDNMQLPAAGPVQRSATIVGAGSRVTYTRERPWHGRSGGALLDMDSGYLIGVVQGYEVGGARRGLYVSHAAILRFLARSQQRSGPPGPTPFPLRGGNPPLPYSFPCPGRT